jgi:hypothetical protein
MKMLSRKYWHDVFDPAMIIKTTLQTIVGTILIGSFFMVANDYIFIPIDINGRWNLTLKPEKAKSMKNQCVYITYSVLLVQNGKEIVGHGEKSQDFKSPESSCEDVNIPERTIDPGKGKKINISGFIQNNYIANDSITLSYQEGKKNDLRFTMASFGVSDDNELHGWYKSNISRAEGKILLSRVR